MFYALILVILHHFDVCKVIKFFYTKYTRLFREYRDVKFAHGFQLIDYLNLLISKTNIYGLREFSIDH